MSRHTKTYSQPSVHKSRYEIIKQMLQTVNSKKHGNVKLFELVYRCNLTWPQFKVYKALLIRREFLLITSIPHGHAQRYNHTFKGIRFLDYSKRWRTIYSPTEDDLEQADP